MICFKQFGHAALVISTHRGQVSHICVSKLILRQCRVPCPASNHSFNQCWYVANLDRQQQISVNFYSKYNNFIQESGFENVVFTMAAILFGAQYCIFNWWVIVCMCFFIFTTSRCHHIIFINLFIFRHDIVLYGSDMISSCTGGSH